MHIQIGVHIYHIPQSFCLGMIFSGGIEMKEYGFSKADVSMVSIKITFKIGVVSKQENGYNNSERGFNRFLGAIL